MTADSSRLMSFLDAYDNGTQLCCWPSKWCACLFKVFLDQSILAAAWGQISNEHRMRVCLLPDGARLNPSNLLDGTYPKVG